MIIKCSCGWYGEEEDLDIAEICYNCDEYIIIIYHCPSCGDDLYSY